MVRYIKIAVFLIACLGLFDNYSESCAQHLDVDGFISVSAEGASDAGSDLSEARRKKTAAESAYYAAVQKLAEYVAGVEVSGGIRLIDLRFAGGTVTEFIKAELRGIEEISCTFTRLDDGSYLARSTVRLPALERERVVKHIVELSGLSDNGVSQFYLVKEGTLASTGIIVDLRMLAPPGWIPAVPVLRAESGREVFHPGQVKAEYLLARPPVGYAASMADAKEMLERIGQNPLIIRAIGISNNSLQDIIISEGDAGLINELQDRTGFLDCGKIVLVL